MCEYISDVLRDIKKCDIYTCDLGDFPDLITLGKVRPCVIVQSDELNFPITNSFMIAPIRSEHSMEVTEENVKECVSMRRQSGRIYIPIQITKGRISFIDMTQTRQIDSSKIDKYVGKIVKEEIRSQINTELFKLFFSKEEISSLFPPVQQQEPQVVVQKTPKSDGVVNVQQHHSVVNLKPIDAKSDMAEKINQTITAAAIVEKALPAAVVKNNTNEDKVTELCKLVDMGLMNRHLAASKLGMHISTFNEVMKNYTNNKKEESKKESSKTPKGMGFPKGFSVYYKAFVENKMTANEIAEKLGKHVSTVYNYIKRYEEAQKQLDKNKLVTL